MFKYVKLALITSALLAGLAEAQCPLADQQANTIPVKAYWKDGTRLEFGEQAFTAKINTQLQPRYEFTDKDGKDNTSSFRMRRARLQVEGTVLDKEFGYRIQGDFVGSKDSNTGESETDLRDAYLQWNAATEAAFRMGQFKTAVGRQENNSSAKLQFPDRTAASDFFTISRNQGARVAGDLGGVQYLIGIFNGESSGEGRNLPGVDTGHTGDIGLRGTLLGQMDAMEEGDISITDELAINVGAVYSYSDADKEFNENLEAVDLHRISADANFKYRGWSLHNEIFYLKNDANTSDFNFDNVGGYVQTGYFLVPEKWELAGRYGIIDCDNGKSVGICKENDLVHEAGVVLNRFFWGHNLKAQLGYTYLTEDKAEDGASDVDTNKIIFQISAYF